MPGKQTTNTREQNSLAAKCVCRPSLEAAGPEPRGRAPLRMTECRELPPSERAL